MPCRPAAAGRGGRGSGSKVSSPRIRVGASRDGGV